MPKPSLDEIFQTSDKPSLDEIFNEQQKTKPMFSSIGDAIAANRLAEIEQARAVRGTSKMNLAVNTAGKTLLDFLGTPSRVTSQLAMDVATGQNTGTKLSNLGKALTAQKESNWGDVLRAGGVPNAPAAVGGFLGDIAVSPGGIQALKGAGNLAIKGAQAVGKGIESSPVAKVSSRFIESFKGPSSADLKATLDQKVLELSKQKENLTNLFTSKTKEVVGKVKPEVSRISKDMSTAYGEGLDNIFSKLEDPIQAGSILKKNAPPITNQELVGKLEDLVNRTSKDPLIVKSPAYSKVVKMLDFYKNGAKSEAGLVDETGRILSSNAPEAVDIKQLIAQTRDIRSTISKADKPIGSEDYFATQFDSVVSGLLKNRVEGFDALQKSYAPMANTRKVAYKIFKPLSDEDSATALFNRIKNNNLRSSDEKLIKFLESGGEVGGKKIAGVGDISSEFKNIGLKLKKINSKDEIRELAIKVSKKAADEKFRNAVLTWAAAASGVGATAIGGAKLFSKD